MGIAPDLSAVRASIKRKKNKTKSIAPSSKNIHDDDGREEKPRRQNPATSPENSTVKVRDVENEITKASVTRRREAADQKAFERLRREDLKDLKDSADLSDEDAGDGPVIVDTDTALSRDFEVQSRQAMRRRRLGGAIGVEDLRRLQQEEEFEAQQKQLEIKKRVEELKEVAEEGPGEVIYRDEQGVRITHAKWLELEAAKKGGYKLKKKETKGKEEYKPVAWGGGLVQGELQKKKQEEEKRLQSQPLTRHEIDESFDKELREKVRWNDPMRNIVSNEMTHSSSSSTSIPTRKKCPFSAPPNRFGIQPGYRWDGNVRGTGYEDRLLESINQKRHKKTESYKWSIEDM